MYIYNFAYFYLLTNLSYLVSEIALKSQPVHYCMVQRSYRPNLVFKCCVQKRLTLGFELFVSGNKIGFTIQLDGCRLFIIVADLDQNQPLICIPVSSFFGNLLAFFTKDFDSLVEVSISFCKCFFTVHHTGTCGLAKLHHIFCTNTHGYITLLSG